MVLKRSVSSRRGSISSRTLVWAGRSWGRSCGRESPAPRPMFRVLFLCTGNSARSQMAEALLNWKGRGRFHAESAGSSPADRVNPHAIETLREYHTPWRGRAPRRIDGLEREPWDLVVTVCDRAKESCPIFPGQPIMAHWGMADPALVAGDDRSEEDTSELQSRLHLVCRLLLEKK